MNHLSRGAEAKVSTPPISSQTLQRKCSCGGGCSKCQKKRLSLERWSSVRLEGGPAPAIVHDVLRSPGQALDSSTRQLMEAGFQSDFSRVRVHTNRQADASARAVHAQAYTVGQHVVFADGAYQPGSFGGRELIAHELAHVLQQQEAEPRGTLAIGTDGAAEHEAHTLSRIVAAGGRVAAPRTAPAMLQRAPGAQPDVRWLRTWRGSGTQSDIEISITFAGDKAQNPANWYEGSVKGKDGQGFFSGAVTGDRLSGNFNIFLTVGGRRNGPASMNLLAGGFQLEPVFSYSPLGHIRTMSAAPNPAPAPPPPPPPTLEKKGCCGPDISSALENTLISLKRDFAAMPQYEQVARCYEIVGLGLNAVKSSWEISYLVEAQWQNEYYKAGCAQPFGGVKDREACSHSVQVGGACQNVYTPNYALFGTMCRLCNDRLSGTNFYTPRHSLAGMMAIVAGYQLTVKTADGRFIAFIDEHQFDWAKLAHQSNGWVRSNGTPASDYMCKTECKKAFPSGPMKYRWEPLQVTQPVDTFHNVVGTNPSKLRIAINKNSGLTSGSTHQGTITHGVVNAIFIGKVSNGEFNGSIEIKRAGRTMRGTVKFTMRGSKMSGYVEPAPLNNLFNVGGGGGQLLIFDMMSTDPTRPLPP